MKCFLREGFSLEVGDKIIIGPKEIEVDDIVYSLNKHKFESIAEMEVIEALESELKPKKKK